MMISIEILNKNHSGNRLYKKYVQTRAEDEKNPFFVSEKNL